MGMLLDLALKAGSGLERRTDEPHRLPDPAAETELRRLVNLVADANGFSPEDRREALEVALRDPERALQCFRLLYAECSGTVH